MSLLRVPLSATLALVALASACDDKGYNYDIPEDTGDTASADGADGGAEDDADGDGYTEQTGDCDDGDDSVNPDATEVCDGVDNDCDGVTDEQDAADVTTWYFDGDGDGYGDPDSSAVACDPITNHTDQPGDCDDDRDTVYPGADEICDGVDNDCNGEVDEGDIASAPTWYYDADGDGYGTADDTVTGCDAPSGYVAEGTDCDDTNAAINPDASDGTRDGIDDNCDGTADEEAGCNPYRPFGAGASSTRTYATQALDGNSYTETMIIRSWDSAAGVAVLERSFAGTSGNITVQETHLCNGAAVQMSGWVYQDSLGLSSTFTYSTPRTDLEDAATMTAGTRWSYSYTATDSISGVSWSASGDMEVAGTESVSVGAGTFDALKVDNDYEIIDSSGTVGSRTGVVEIWWVEDLGPVKVLDTSDDGTVNETREMTAYNGFAP